MAVDGERGRVVGAVLGALHSKFQQLSDSARNIHLPEGLRHNITANLSNARDFMGLPSGSDAQPAGRGSPGATATAADSHNPGAPRALIMSASISAALSALAIP